MNHERSEQIAALEPVVRRIARSRLSDPDDVDEVVQETLTRLLEAEERLESATLASYAVVTARNIVTSLQRSRATAARRAPELLDAGAPPDPEEEALRAEEHEAVVAALASLQESERRALVERDVHDVPTKDIAKRQRTTPGATATRLARARARARVEYLLAFRGLRPTSSQCRPVLYAVAAAETRRQKELDAGTHIEQCATCAQLVEPLARRSRGLAAIAPFAALGSAVRASGRAVRQHPITTVGAGVAVVAVAAVVMARPGPDATAPQTPEPRLLTVAGIDALPLPEDFAWWSHIGDTAVARGAPVLSVPSDEGFWVGTSESNRVWVALGGPGESPAQVTRHARVWFQGRLVGNNQGFLRKVDLSGTARSWLAGQGFHIVIPADEIKLSSTS